MKDLSPLRRAIGVVLFVVGLVWFLLGIGIVQGSQITGQLWAAVLGAIAVVAGLLTLNAHKRPLPKNLGKPKTTDEADQPNGDRHE